MLRRNRKKTSNYESDCPTNGHCVDIDNQSSVGVRPASYHEWSEDVSELALPSLSTSMNGTKVTTIKKSTSVVLSSSAAESGVRRRRHSKPLAVLELIFRKLKPTRRTHVSEADAFQQTNGSVVRWECTCEHVDLRRVVTCEAILPHICVSTAGQDGSTIPRCVGVSNYSHIAPLQGQSDSETDRNGHDYLFHGQSDLESMADARTDAAVGELTSSNGETSLTLAELVLNSNANAKEDMDSVRANAIVPNSNVNDSSVAVSMSVPHIPPVSGNLNPSPTADSSHSTEHVSVNPATADDTMAPDDQPSTRWTLAQELNRLSHYGWYWGPVSREEAEDKLADQPEGSFLVRDSTDDRYLFSLSFRSSGRTLHSRVEYCNGEFSFYAQPLSDSYRSMVDLIERCVADSQSGVYCYSRGAANGPIAHSYPVKLTRPVSRFSQVRTLQYLCRFVIRQHTRIDHIQSLPLPVSVKVFLKENQY